MYIVVMYVTQFSIKYIGANMHALLAKKYSGMLVVPTISYQ